MSASSVDSDSSYDNDNDNDNDEKEVEMSLIWKQQDDDDDDDDDDGLFWRSNPRRRNEISWKEYPSLSNPKRCIWKRWNVWIGMMIVLLGIICMYFYFALPNEERPASLTDNMNIAEQFVSSINSTIFPNDLLTQNVYHKTDFFNNDMMVPYWQGVYQSLSNQPHQKNKTTIRTRHHFLKEENQNQTVHSWGPCYAPNPDDTASLDWNALIHKYQSQTDTSNTNEDCIASVEYPSYNGHRGQGEPLQALAGMCRPGFLIIGAGKCGTSSLYHYLVNGHPRILPAKEKQIHYFRYHLDQPMSWYLSHFPTTQYFLSTGALMTGEASPGYVPYLNVPYKIQKHMSRIATTTATTTTTAIATVSSRNHEMPKMINIVRNPLQRAYSSYKYNYVQEAIGKLQSDDDTIPTEEYNEYLFSFQDFMQVELNRLKECLKPDGTAERMAMKKLNTMKKLNKKNYDLTTTSIVLRDLEGGCYSNDLNDGVPRMWDSLLNKHPKKILKELGGIYHLIRSFIGRSLYVLALNWWYIEYTHPDDIHIVCTEELAQDPVSTMSQVTSFLGLPPHDFTNEVSKGAYNVGGATGYDTLTSWDNYNYTTYQDIPLTKEFQQEFWDFVQPFTNELTQLIGKECPHWNH